MPQARRGEHSAVTAPSRAESHACSGDSSAKFFSVLMLAAGHHPPQMCGYGLPRSSIRIASVQERELLIVAQAAVVQGQLQTYPLHRLPDRLRQQPHDLLGTPRLQIANRLRLQKLKNLPGVIVLPKQ